MLHRSPRSIWTVSIAVSVAVHVGAVAFAGYAWGEKEDRAREIPRIVHRDIGFLLGYLRAEAKAVAEAAERQKPLPLPDPGKPEASAAAPPGPAPAAAGVPTGSAKGLPVPPPPRPEPPKPVPQPSEPPKPPAPKPPAAAAAVEPPVVIDAEEVRALQDLKEIPETSPRATLNTSFWLQRANQRIGRNLRELLDGSPAAAGLRGSVALLVIVRRNGTLAEIRVERHSNYPVLDVIAEQCILRSVPFSPFYAGMEMEYLPRRFVIRF